MCIRDSQTPEQGKFVINEVKPAKVIEAQEDYGIRAGQPSGNMGWQVAGKSVGILEELSDRGHGYRLVLPKDIQDWIPKGISPQTGREVKRLDLVPGVDVR